MLQRPVCLYLQNSFLKQENNELNELSECMLYKMFCFSGKHLKTVKLSFTIIFQKLCLLTLKFLKLSALACF